MNKNMMIFAAILGFSTLFASPVMVLANEGTANLKAEPGQIGSCFAASVFIDGSYKILMTCRDMPMALTAEQNQYIVWKESAGKQTQVSSLNNGKMSTVVSAKFDRLFITAEGSNYESVPKGPVVVSGNITPIKFEGGSGTVTQGGYPTVTAAPVVSVGKNMITPIPDETGANRLGAALAGVGKAIILGFVVLLVIVGVLGFLARRRGL